MNGFDKEMRDRILWFIPHIVAHETIISDKLSEYQGDFSSHPEIVEVEYFKTVDALVFHKKSVETTSILAFDFNDSQELPRITRFPSSDDLSGVNFSGDAGAYLIATIIGYLSIEISSLNKNDLSPIFIVILFWYPVFENLFSFIRRTISKNSQVNADKVHLHHLIYYSLLT